jgi:uncharacterized membrane protein
MHLRNPIEWVFGQWDAADTIGSARPEEYWPVTQPDLTLVVQKITVADLRDAVRRGLHDFAAARTDVMFVSVIYPIIGLFIAVAEARGQFLPLLFPTAAGFALVGPFFAVGMYEMSRHREQTGKATWLDMFKVMRSPSIGAIAGLGGLLIVLFLAWLAVAEVIYDVTMGPRPPASTLDFINGVFTTGAGWAMIGLGLVAGLIFSVAVLAISVVSFPLLLDRPVGIGTAIRTSLMAVRRNPVTLGLWGLFVAVSLSIGAVPCFVGLIVVLPVLGHSTWHLYRRVVRPPAVKMVSEVSDQGVLPLL